MGTPFLTRIMTYCGVACLLFLTACSETPTSIPQAAGGVLAEAPAAVATAPALPPTATQQSPTSTAIAATNTTISPTNTVVPSTNTAIPPTNSPVPPTDTRIPPTNSPVPPTKTLVPPVALEPTSTPLPQPIPTVPMIVGQNPGRYDVYLKAAVKPKQEYHYTCEFDAAWVVLKTYGVEANVAQQLAIIGQDKSVEPSVKNTANGTLIIGGDVYNYYSGNYATNFLARTTGYAMKKIFAYYGMPVTAVRDKTSLIGALNKGQLVWIKATADFLAGKPATWVMPNGKTYQTVLGNDHAVVVIGYNANVVVIRDVLGPTSTNLNRKYEYEVPWGTFMAIWGSQAYDGLAVAPA